MFFVSFGNEELFPDASTYEGGWWRRRLVEEQGPVLPLPTDLGPSRDACTQWVGNKESKIKSVDASASSTKEAKRDGRSTPATEDQSRSI